MSTGEIKDLTRFTVKSLDLSVSLALQAKQISLLEWKIIVVTVFRETKDNQLRVPANMLVYNK